MVDTPTGWHEITRTRFRAGEREYDFIDGPAAGRHTIDVRAPRALPAPYAVMENAGLTREVVYVRHRGGRARWFYEFHREIRIGLGHITCPECGLTSYHPKDKQHGWCANCSAYTQIAMDERPVPR